jgi:hypothetical protein
MNEKRSHFLHRFLHSFLSTGVGHFTNFPLHPQTVCPFVTSPIYHFAHLPLQPQDARRVRQHLRCGVQKN